MITHPNLSCSLHPLEEKYSEVLFNWRNDERIFKWCRQHDLLTEQSHKTWFIKNQTDPKTKMYLIKTSEYSVPIGVCGFTDIDLINQRAEFSLYIAPAHHKQGYGREALQLLLWHGFRAYPFKIIYGESFDNNPAIEMFLKLGFKKEGIRRDFYFRDGKHIDAHLFSIKKEELII